GAFEEPPFRREIVFERFVIIHVLARQIREHRRVKMAAPQTVHRKRVRTRLQHRVLSSRIANLGKESLQIHGFRSGIGSGMVTEPRFTASSINVFPSALAPCNAKKSAPFSTLRESQVTS